MSDEEVDIEGTNMFEEPEGFLPPPPEPHFVTYKRKTKKPEEVKLRLVGKSPLWGHLLWNAGVFTADYMDEHAETLVKGKRVLELGAAAALPSVIAAMNGAQKVVATDYPDPELIQNIEYNFKANNTVDNSEVKGLIWGNDASEMLDKKQLEEEDKFDLVILSDLIFNHTEHLKLLKNCRQLTKKTGKCLVVFSPHRPKLLHKDLEFFKTCEQFQFKAEKIDLVVWTPMFEEDQESIEVRSRVYSFFLNPQW